jgi:ribose 1,5-bisphosphate isomerase
MISENIKKIAKEIKEIKIQGASNIEMAAIKGILDYLRHTDKLEEELIKEIKENINHLIIQRPNEPKLRNSMNYIFQKVVKYSNNTKIIEEKIEKYKENTENGNLKVSAMASQLITNGSKILTHCHSTLVENALKIAHDKKIDFEVFCTETRPRYQGRITAKNLSDYGIKTTLVTDASVTHFLKPIDYFFTGADVIFSDGSIMNKLGTHTISLAAKEFKTNHIVLTTTHCVETNDLLSFIQEIETRDQDEIWEKENRPKNLKIINPAFDIVPNELIDKFITEEGVFSPETLSFWVNQFRKNL